MRRLLIIGATAVVRWAARNGAPAGSWLARMLARKPRMLVRRGAGQQDGAHRLGAAGARRGLSGSGGGGVIGRGLRLSGRRKVEGEVWRNGR